MVSDFCSYYWGEGEIKKKKKLSGRKKLKEIYSVCRLVSGY